MRSSPVSMFDRWSSGYDDSALQQAYARAHQGILGWAARVDRRPRRILDVGCGTGRLLAEAARAFPQADLVGVDPSAGMLSLAVARKPPRCRLVQAGVEHLPLLGAAFDLVTTTYSIRHWSDPEAGLRQIARVLAPGGLFGLVDVFPEHRCARVWRHRFGPAGRLPPAVARMLGAAGLRLAGVTTIGGCGVVTDMTAAVAVHGDTPARTSPAWSIRR